MINEKKQIKAIQAIQDLIIEARRLANENTSNNNLANFLDGIEYLPALIIEEKDNTVFFETFLEDLCIRYECKFIIEKYIKP